MEKVIDTLSRLSIHARCGSQGFYGGLFYGFDIFKMAHQCLAAGGADIRDVIQYGVNLAFAAQASVIFDRETMGLVLDSGNQLKTLRILVNADFTFW